MGYAVALVMSVYCCRSFFDQKYRDTPDRVGYEIFAGRFAVVRCNAVTHQVDTAALMRKIPE